MKESKCGAEGTDFQQQKHIHREHKLLKKMHLGLMIYEPLLSFVYYISMGETESNKKYTKRS